MIIAILTSQLLLLTVLAPLTLGAQASKRPAEPPGLTATITLNIGGVDESRDA